MKSCNREGCKETNPQPLTAFYKDKGFQSGYRPECKSCRNIRHARWRENNRDKWNAYMREFRSEHPLSIKDKIHKKNRVMRCRYGIEIGHYNAMLTAQNNSCPICQKHRSELRKDLVVDHCHDTGKVRGLLCFSCNRSIAILDDPTLFERALAYLKK